ncbi:hemerythrin domain-containing protein, partial [Vibrio parahaemolyticus]|nr:hemerythrin domain-containing protein [Vibrio parahaemolyticus]
IDLTRHGIAEHHEIDKVIAQLDATDMSSPAWLNLMKTLRHKVLHHLEEEEQRFFQLAGKVMTDKQKMKLADGYVEEVA